MTLEELRQIIKRDMPGWDLAEDFRLNCRFKGEGNFIVLVQKGSQRKTAVVSGGWVTGAQG